MRRIRVGWLAPEDSTLPPVAHRGSITNDIWQLASRLASRCELVIGAREHPIFGEADHELDGIRYVRNRPRADLRRARAITKLNQAQRRLGLLDLPYAGRASYFRGYARAHGEHFRREAVDLVHFHNVSQWAPLLRRALPETPLVLQMDCEWLAEIPRAQGLERLRQVDRVLCVSEQIAAQIRERYPERATIVEVLPNGVDVEEFAPADRVRAERSREVEALRRRLGLDDGPVVLFLGRLSAEKGLHVLLEAVPTVLSHVPGAQVVLCGGRIGLRSPLPTRERPELRDHPEWRARYVDHLQRLAEASPGRVVFAGRLASDEVPLAFALADVYVQPSLFESFGLPVVEAMASELPVVVSDGGALPEHVEQGVTGFVVPYGDPRALGETIARVLADPALARRLGRAGRERARRSRTWDAAAEGLFELYADVAQPGAGSNTPACVAS